MCHSRVDIEELDASAYLDILASVTALQADAYRPPPWSYSDEEIAEFPGELERQLGFPGFRAITAHRAGRLVGTAYGVPGPERIPNSGAFYRPVVTALGRHRADVLLSDHPFEVVQLMVDPATQRQGIGRAILQRLVVKATRAWLVTLPDSPASQVYLASGWQPQRPRFPLWGREVEIWTLGI